MNNHLTLSQSLMMIIKIIIAITAASIIYNFCQYITMADIKIAIGSLEAKIFRIFSGSYKIAYTSKYGYELERSISDFLNDSYVSEVLVKYKLVFYDGVLLAFFMLLVIITLIGHLWFEISKIIENKISISLEENHSIDQSNISSLINENPKKTKPQSKNENISKNQNKIKKTREYQDI